jgi:hypothetical protein
LKLDYETNRIFRAEYRDSAINLVVEFNARLKRENTYSHLQSPFDDTEVSGLIGAGTIMNVASALTNIAKQLP